MAEIRPADLSRQAHLAELFGRAFVTEPTMTWPLGGRADDLEERCIRAYWRYLEPLLDLGIVWETADGHGALILVPPGQDDAWDDALAQVDEALAQDMTDDAGDRHHRLWGWIASKIPSEPLWQLDSVAVEPGWQGHGIGSSLVEFGLEQARDSNLAVILETGTPRNVPLYERHGFQVVEDADPPGGGPHVWFMRHDA